MTAKLKQTEMFPKLSWGIFCYFAGDRPVAAHEVHTSLKMFDGQTFSEKYEEAEMYASKLLALHAIKMRSSKWKRDLRRHLFVKEL